jgi:hypothetical protein
MFNQTFPQQAHATLLPLIALECIIHQIYWVVHKFLEVSWAWWQMALGKGNLCIFSSLGVWL